MNEQQHRCLRRTIVTSSLLLQVSAAERNKLVSGRLCRQIPLVTSQILPVHRTGKIRKIKDGFVSVQGAAGLLLLPEEGWMKQIPNSVGPLIA